MTTYLIRHARTAYSADYRVNGRPEAGIPIDHVGCEQCRDARERHRLDDVVTCVVSDFLRAGQTADLLLTSTIVSRSADRRLGEIDYGVFEGRAFLEYGRWLEEHGPWQRPPGSPESQREGILRMLAGLRDVLRMPGPRVVVAHGLLVSVVQQGSVNGIFFPEAPYVTPIRISDDELWNLAVRLADEIDRERTSLPSRRWAGRISADA